MQPSRSLGERIKALRELVPGLSARELARLIGLAEPQVGMIEARKQRSVRPDILRGLASALGARVDWLLFEEGAGPTAEQVREAVERARRARDPNTIADEAEEATGPVVCPPVDDLEDPRPSMTGTDGR